MLVYHPIMMGLAKDLHDAFGLPVVLGALFPRAAAVGDEAEALSPPGALFPRTPSRELAPLYYSRLGDDAPNGSEDAADFVVRASVARGVPARCAASVGGAESTAAAPASAEPSPAWQERRGSQVHPVSIAAESAPSEPATTPSAAVDQARVPRTP